MRLPPRPLIVFTSLAFSIAPSVGWSQSSTPEAHLQRGVALRRESHDVEALAEFRAAWEASHEARARAQMGLAEQSLGRWLEAEAHLDEALAAVGDPWIERYRAALEGARRAIAEHLGSLDVRCDAPGAEVRIAGRATETLPMARPARVLAGEVTLEVSAPSHRPLTRSVTVTPGEVTREAITLEALPAPVVTAPAPTPTPPPPRVEPRPPHPRSTRSTRGATQRVLGGASAGGAALFVGAGAALFVVAHTAEGRYNGAQCDDLPGVPRSARCASDRSTALTTQALGGVGLGVAGALGVTALVLFLTAPRDAERPHAARLGCGPGPGDLGLACGAAF
jgi:hypothetical protein